MALWKPIGLHRHSSARAECGERPLRLCTLSRLVPKLLFGEESACSDERQPHRAVGEDGLTLRQQFRDQFTLGTLGEQRGQWYELAQPYNARERRFLVLSGSAGLTPTEPGWKTVRYQPHPVEGVRHASASIETIRGRAAVAWSDTDGSFTCTVTVPPGATGQVVLPIGPGSAEVWRDGGSVHKTNNSGDRTTYTATVSSGAYSFEVRAGNDG